ncbi:cinnamoyl-CoA reductase [Aspergillus sclerotioniger CBS 115572]|uniref:Cinnamoyl-CoA reductase n=1 Tax=Aspergillus sclerotioniger CBS 115572 TaxID=1450535 RepID=A0A317VTQ0_9EURO|nr:cinnamoyl-CoA reductase [Aspergillus sclerotioniger CBS 115572]PWY77305.1 cinnamoyl-CoA reductase [Aspergillus sclerotioniger CBS 115572]
MAPIILLTGATGLIGFRILIEILKSSAYDVRITTRSQEKADSILANSAIQSLSPGDRLSSIIIPDSTTPNAFDSALKDITYVIYAGSPVPVPGFDATTQIWTPSITGPANLLSTALKYPSIKRIVITSSIVGTLDPIPNPYITATATTRIHLPALPSAFTSIFEAYILAKITELNMTDSFMETKKPHFSVAHIIPGYVFGRDERIYDANTARNNRSSCGMLLRGFTGSGIPSHMHGGFVHIDDLAAVHMKVLELEPTPDTPTSFGACTVVDFSRVWEIIEKKFPKAVAEGIFECGSLHTLPIAYDSSETERILGIKLRPFEEAVSDVAMQYLGLMGEGGFVDRMGSLI